VCEVTRNDRPIKSNLGVCRTRASAVLGSMLMCAFDPSGRVGRRMDNKLLDRYRKYASSDEAFAVIFVRKHLVQAKEHWVDAVDYRRYEMSPDNLHFRFVRGGLYRRTLQPQYPQKSTCVVDGKFDEERYYQLVRAITWEAAHMDIGQQKARKVRPLNFEVTGVSYDKNRDNKGFFREDAPPEIKALANNLHDRTDPLWDKALQYANAPEYVYEVRRARLV